eukprot:5075629-Pleurochrysis_carterae.AAC.1
MTLTLFYGVCLLHSIRTAPAGCTSLHVSLIVDDACSERLALLRRHANVSAMRNIGEKLALNV